MAPRVTLESLAIMVKKGFENTDRDIAEFRAEMNAFKANTESAVDRIDLRLTQAAYRFELQDVERRISIIENKIGLPG